MWRDRWSSSRQANDHDDVIYDVARRRRLSIARMGLDDRINVGVCSQQKCLRERIAAGVVLYDGEATVPFGDGSADDVCVGRLARSFDAPAGMTCIDARVAAIGVRTREDSAGEFADLVRCDRWEVVVPELVFAPGKR
jgi:hypothetical protein